MLLWGMELGPGFASPNPVDFVFEAYAMYIDKNMLPEDLSLSGLHPNVKIYTSRQRVRHCNLRHCYLRLWPCEVKLVMRTPMEIRIWHKRQLLRTLEHVVLNVSPLSDVTWWKPRTRCWCRNTVFLWLFAARMQKMNVLLEEIKTLLIDLKKNWINNYICHQLWKTSWPQSDSMKYRADIYSRFVNGWRKPGHPRNWFHAGSKICFCIPHSWKRGNPTLIRHILCSFRVCSIQQRSELRAYK